jgi:hypothetical protein
MHKLSCGCTQCRSSGEFEMLEFAPAWAGEDEGEAAYEDEFGYEAEGEGEDETARAFDEGEEYELAMELLSLSSEEELDQFLGKLVKGAWRGLKKVGRTVGRLAKPLGGVLRGVAKAALPFVGGALGSFIPIPGVGTMLGRAVGQAVSSALEAEVQGLEGEMRNVELARRFVRVAGSAARHAARQDARSGAAGDPQATARRAVEAAARRHLPQMRRATGSTGGTGAGRWQRRGDVIVLFGA